MDRMSDGKRRRYRRGRDDKDKDRQRLVILAKREDDPRSAKDGSVDIKPKILLKPKDPDPLTSDSHRTIIATRSDAGTSKSPALSAAVSPNGGATTTTSNVDAITHNLTNMQIMEPLPIMTRPTIIVSTSGLVNANAKKLLMKNNTDFLVVAVIGAQGVGKSTIMNLLAREGTAKTNSYHMLSEDYNIFRTRTKTNKGWTRAATDSMHMFITADRVILLDTPALMANPYKKDMTSSESDDLHMLIGLMTVCHLLVVVQDDYMNLNLIRLLRFAELMKPQIQEDKYLPNSYLPNVLFVKNHAKGCHYMSMQEAEFEIIVRACFNDSQLNVTMGKSLKQIADMQQLTLDEQNSPAIRQKRTRAITNEQDKNPLNCVYIPNIEDSADLESNKQLKLERSVKEFRRLVFMTPRNHMYNGAAELFTEVVWFDMFTRVWQETQYFFLNTYEDMQRKIYDVAIYKGNGTNNNNIGGNGSGSGSTSSNINGGHHNSYGKEMGDWKD